MKTSDIEYEEKKGQHTKKQTTGASGVTYE